MAIEWNDGRTEIFSVAAQGTAADDWAQIARELGLKHYNGVFPMFFDPTNIHEMAAEFQLLSREVISRGGDTSLRLRQLAEALERLRTASGWEGMLG